MVPACHPLPRRTRPRTHPHTPSFRFPLSTFFFLRPRPLPAAALPADATEDPLVDIAAKLNALTPAQRAGFVKKLNT
jgi:hypothetical protein